MQQEQQQELIRQLRQGSERAFTLLFRRYYRDLVLFAGSFLPDDKDACEDIVQNTFLNLWTKRAEADIRTSAKSFLLKSVQNACLDELRHRKVVQRHQAVSELEIDRDDFSTEHHVLYSDLARHLDKALEKIPDTHKNAFEMSRFQGAKYKDIARELNVSERTVEERVGKTIRLLRRYLKDFLFSFTLFAFFITLACVDLGGTNVFSV